MMRIVASPIGCKLGIPLADWGWHTDRSRCIFRYMRRGDVTCPECGAGYRRIEVSSLEGQPGEYRCLTCGHPLEKFTGESCVAYRLTVQPGKIFDQARD